MKTFGIRFDTIDDIQQFSNIASKYPYDIDVAQGKYIVNGKSIMGLLSLDMSKVAYVTVDSDSEFFWYELEALTTSSVVEAESLSQDLEKKE